MTSTESSPVLRLTVLTVLVAILLGALLSRLWFLQVLAGDRYAELAQSNEVRTVLTEAPRGRILDRNGIELVKNRVAETISADRKRLLNDAGTPRDADAEAVLQRLSTLLDLPEDEIIQRMTSTRYSPLRPTPIAFDVAPEVVFAVREHAELFPGVVAERVPVRTYPYGELAGHDLGYVREISQDQLGEEFFSNRGYQPGDMVGKAGIERGYEQYLQGTEGIRRLRVNRSQTVLGVISEQPPSPGNDVVTTIDAKLQGAVEGILQQGVEASRNDTHSKTGRKLPSTGAAAVVLDPRNGEIRAMASYPTFDPSQFVGQLSEKYSRYLYPQEGDADTNSPWLNRAIAATHPPGSVWKIVTGLAALTTGQITPTSQVDCPAVWGDTNKSNWNGVSEGPMNLTTALKRSCDTFFYELSYQNWVADEQAKNAGQQPSEVYADVAQQLGFGNTLGIDIPGERSGQVPNRAWKQRYWEANQERWCAMVKEYPADSYDGQVLSDNCAKGYVWFPGDAVNAAIGQGDVLATPLQVATAYGAVANGGTVYWPHLGKEVRDPEGKVVTTIDPKVETEVDASAADWTAIQNGVEQVVMASNGTGRTPFIGFPLDTIPVAGKTGTAQAGPGTVPFSWFASYAPADNPQYVVVVMVEQGGGGSQTSAPMVRRIYDAIFDLPVERFQPGPADILD